MAQSNNSFVAVPVYNSSKDEFSVIDTKTQKDITKIFVEETEKSGGNADNKMWYADEFGCLLVSKKDEQTKKNFWRATRPNKNNFVPSNLVSEIAKVQKAAISKKLVTQLDNVASKIAKEIASKKTAKKATPKTSKKAAKKVAKKVAPKVEEIDFFNVEEIVEVKS